MGANVLYEGKDLEVLADVPNYYDWIMETFCSHVRGWVIEYGAGAGTVSKLLSPFADRLTLVEPSNNLSELLQAQFGENSRTEVATETLEQHTTRMKSGSADTIVLVNVLEHIEDDETAVSELLRLLKPGGHLLIFVPALQPLMSKLDQALGHYRRYHKADLARKLARPGGELVSCRYFDFIGIAPWFVLNTLLGSTNFDPRLVRINDRIVVPAARMLERLISPPIGKNLIAVVRKVSP